MQAINLIFPHQLFQNSPIAENGHPVYLVEEYLFFRQYAFHKQKLAFHRASMKFYAGYMQEKAFPSITSMRMINGQIFAN